MLWSSYWDSKKINHEQLVQKLGHDWYSSRTTQVLLFHGERCNSIKCNRGLHEVAYAVIQASGITLWLLLEHYKALSTNALSVTLRDIDVILFRSSCYTLMIDSDTSSTPWDWIHVTFAHSDWRKSSNMIKLLLYSFFYWLLFYRFMYLLCFELLISRWINSSIQFDWFIDLLINWCVY